MAVEYRDIGTLNDISSANQLVNNIKHTQVYMATHDGAGNRLPFMDRSFISFSYGGRHIEDFGLIAITENNALQRNLYAEFEDNVTESSLFDGQIYWDTHYKANKLDLALFTDGITEIQLEDFKHWFVPGTIRELILAEHPNRGILARIATPPQYSMLPFEEKIETTVANRKVNTSTTIYRGKITISFIMDEPFWYSLANILGHPLKIFENTQSWHIISDSYNQTSSVEIVDVNSSTGNELSATVLIKEYNIKVDLQNCQNFTISIPEILILDSTVQYIEAGNSIVRDGIFFKAELAIYNKNNQLIGTEVLTSYAHNAMKRTRNGKPIIVSMSNPAVEYNCIFKNSEYKEQASYGKLILYSLADFTYEDSEIILTQQILKNSDLWAAMDQKTTVEVEDKDVFKIITEDRVPITEMKAAFEDDLGNVPTEDVMLVGGSIVLTADLSTAEVGSRVASNDSSDDGAAADYGHIAYHMTEQIGINLAQNEALMFYYPGTAPGKPILRFTLTPQISIDSITDPGNSGYINTPGNSFASTTMYPYTTITIYGEKKQYFYFTTPSIWTGYNQAMWIFNHIDENIAFEEIRQSLRDNIKHFAPRIYAIKTVDKCEEQAEGRVKPNESDLILMLNDMKYFLKNSNNEYYPATFEFNSKNGKAKGWFTYNRTPYYHDNNLQNLEEDTGDMVKSKYLTIMERNILTPEGFIGKRFINGHEHPEYCQLLTHNSDITLYNVNLEYKYLYL